MKKTNGKRTAQLEATPPERKLLVSWQPFVDGIYWTDLECGPNEAICSAPEILAQVLSMPLRQAAGSHELMLVSFDVRETWRHDPPVNIDGHNILFTSRRSVGPRPYQSFAKAVELDSRRKTDASDDGTTPCTIAVWDDDYSSMVMFPVLISDVDYYSWLFSHNLVPAIQRRLPSPRFKLESGQPGDYLHHVWNNIIMKSATNGDSPTVGPNLLSAIRPGCEHLCSNLKTDTRDFPWVSRFILLRPMTRYMAHSFLRANNIRFREVEIW
jgi:hypothetical protein